MGKILSTARKPLRNFNIEDRAHKVISRDKPIAAPKYQADVTDYQRILKDHPEIVEDSLKKHEALDKNLKNIFVTSHDPPPRVVSQQDDKRPLPLNRGVVEDFELGFKEPTDVPLGKATLRNVMRFIGMHQNNPKHNTAEKIAAEYDLDIYKVSKVLKYVRVFEVYIPEQKNSKQVFVGPSLPKTMLKKIPRPQLLSGKKKDEGDV